MDRITWLREMRLNCEKQYDTRWAPLYGERWGLYSNTTHQQFIQEFLSLLSPGSIVLDAACGAGRYLSFLLEKEHSVIGIDQSQGMLARARSKFPTLQFEKVGLQEMAYRGDFDGAICVDAIENVCPEDWPLVLGNFHRALKQHGYLYFTAETIENTNDDEIKQAFHRAQQAELPVVYGEWPDEYVYHYHPATQQVKEWTQQIGFEILKEGVGDNYYHLIVRKAAGISEQK
jgi:cyclopropane fatty-acyl-phospholipid synthase-like methyltransferase